MVKLSAVKLGILVCIMTPMYAGEEWMVAVVLLVVCHMTITYWTYLDGVIKASNLGKKIAIKLGRPALDSKRFLILYYNPSPFISKNRKYAISCGFETCKWNNCDMTFDRTYANRSNAVIYDGIFMPKSLRFTRPRGQVWIFAAQESPLKYGMGANWWYRKPEYIFNWTMTYNINNTDIFLPYGEIQKYKEVVKKDYTSIALKKNRTLLIITSNCKAKSKRQKYVERLQNYIDVDVLGQCGKKWDCGVHFRHDDDCFKLLNTYKFFLAFENAFCHQYFTEKFFENFNYDTIMITRGGSKGETKRLFPKGTYLATEDFKSIKELAIYLKNLTLSDYVKLLERKSQFYSTGYKLVYQRALCNICERMNLQKTYRKTIPDIKKWAFKGNPCLRSNEVRDIS